MIPGSIKRPRKDIFDFEIPQSICLVLDECPTNKDCWHIYESAHNGEQYYKSGCYCIHNYPCLVASAFIDLDTTNIDVNDIQETVSKTMYNKVLRQK